MSGSKIILLFIIVACLFLMCLFTGTVSIPGTEVLNALTGGENVNEVWRVIVMDSRLPSAIVAALAGGALAIAGLMMQTTFDNPLAGPSVLGVSTGSSLGVAVVLLAFGGSLASLGRQSCVLLGAFAGALLVLAILLFFSRLVRSSVVLLIVGIMVGYLASSAVSLLNFFSTQEGVHSFVIWGMGSFSGVTQQRLLLMSVITLILIFLSFLTVKQLDALLLGENYATNLGINVKRSRSILLFLSGALTAAVTAFCGPIGFIGLIVPHVGRFFAGTSRHAILMPATLLAGCATALFCQWLSTLPANGVIPINAITPVIGVPVIIYILLRRHE